MLVFLNGEFVPDTDATVSVFDRGFLYGDGLFETVRVINGTPFRWREHMERLQAGARFLNIELPFGPRRLSVFARGLAAKNEMLDCLLRLTLSRGAGAPGYSPKGAFLPTITMSLRPAPESARRRPPRWKLMTSSIRVPASDPLASFKTCNKLPQILARAEADDAGVDEALLLNTDGHVAEGTSSNVFLVKRGIIFTPPLAAGNLPGVTRSIVFEIAAGLGVRIREKQLRLRDCAQADEIFLSLTSLGIVEAGWLNGKKLKRAMITNQFIKRYDDILRTECPKE